ncbi:hypothetical protein [Haloarcula quadrata]|uniref:hypothetical protein n=1 Tax=Haloarcula quadrata TaxID=182779 RepID=UPI0011E603D9|nr:hypothetical protein [Haloarcula quadrata]
MSTVSASQITLVSSSVEIINITTDEPESRDELQRGGWVENKTVTVNETVFLSGLTNLQPDDHAVIVDVLNDDFERVATATADRWEMDGVWTVELNTTGLEPGRYTVEATAAGTTDRIELRISEPLPQQTVDKTETPIRTTAETATERSQIDSPTPTPTSTPLVTEKQATQTPIVGPSETPTEGTGAGFGMSTVLATLMLMLLWLRKS